MEDLISGTLELNYAHTSTVRRRAVVRHDQIRMGYADWLRDLGAT